MYHEEVVFYEKTFTHVAISDFRVSQNGEVLKTTLGSCVSVVLYTNRENSICSMSHFLLPKASPLKESEAPLRYGSRIIPMQIEAMEKLGIDKRSLLAKVAGGASMFPLRPPDSNLADVGLENSLMALRILGEEKIPLIAKDIGGDAGRSIQFDPHTLKLKVVIFGDRSFYI